MIPSHLDPRSLNSLHVNESIAVCREKSTHEITEVTNKALNSVSRGRVDHPVSPSSSAIALPSFLRRLWSSARSEGFLEVKNHARRWTRKILNSPRRSVQRPATPADGYDVCPALIDILPDEALLEIFDNYVHEVSMNNGYMTLVHTVGILRC